jgi:CBS domain-containing protein
MEGAMKIKDIMSQPLVTAPETSTGDMVARLMWEFDCGIVPIVAGDGRLVGVITDRDVCMAAYTQGKPLAEIAVASAMSRDVATCRPGDTIPSAEAVLRQRGVRRLLVVDVDNRPVGLVSMNDIARLAERTRAGSYDREFVETLASVCQPRLASAPASTIVAA